MSNSTITLPNWYQFDVVVKGGYKTTLLKIITLIDSFKSKNLIEKWFFLYENPKNTTTYRVRLKSLEKEKLEQMFTHGIERFELAIFDEWPFQAYWEDAGVFPSLDVLETFANIMSSVTELIVKKIQNKINFSNYTLVERLSHCIFNNVYGLSTEAYFLLKRLGISFNDEDNQEQTDLDDKISWKELKSGILNLSGIRVPTKHKEK